MSMEGSNAFSHMGWARVVFLAFRKGRKTAPMVELEIVTKSESSPPVRPVGIFRSLATGFDRIAARPILILPAIILDLFLWLGPRLTIPAFLQQLTSILVIPAGADESLAEQIQAVRAMFLEFGEHLNLFALLSSLPVGISSLMATRMPAEAPFGQVEQVHLIGPAIIFLVWVGLIILGQGLGTQFHLWIAQQVAPREELANRWRAWSNMAALAGMFYICSLIFGLAVALLMSLLTLLLPLLGLIVAFLGFTFAFWLLVYLYFTPHGIIRYRLGIFRAMQESVTLVRWNLIPALGYLGLAFLITWLTNQVWLLPKENSWYLLMAIAGHAFVSATILAGSYVFYQSRREWLLSLKRFGTHFSRESENNIRSNSHHSDDVMG